MTNHSNNNGEMFHVAVITALSAIVGLLILVQLLRAQPMDTFSMLVIGVCFVIAVAYVAWWMQRTERGSAD